VKPHRRASIIAALALFAMAVPATTGLAFAATPPGVGPNLAGAPLQVPAVALQQVQITFIKVLCPTYSVVPANKTPTVADATGGHGGQLDTSYQTVLTNPSTDIPKTCARADGWNFQMYDAFAGAAVGSAMTTGADGAGTGAVTVTLTPTELGLGQTTGSPTGLWIKEVQKPSVATFGALRCGSDIQNGDNIENVRNLGLTNQHLYCIAYNVVVAQPTPTPTPTATPCGVVGVANPAAVQTATPCPTAFQTQAGETGTPAANTPPPTSTDGSGTGGNSIPLLALLICLAFGGLGLAAVEAQRKSVRP
jgi:hypothetical protein